MVQMVYYILTGTRERPEVIEYIVQSRSLPGAILSTITRPFTRHPYLSISAIAASLYLGIYHRRALSNFADTSSLFSSSSNSSGSFSASAPLPKMDPNSVEALTEELKSNPFDPNSFGRPDQAKVSHLHLVLSVDFGAHTLSGYTVLTVNKVAPNATQLLLDTVDLTILGVQLVKDDGSKVILPYKLHVPVPEFGSKLEIDISSVSVAEFKVCVEYRTASSARALQWLTPEQTDGGQYPFMFSQCEAINARSMVPCQDTPAVKATYTAEIEAPTYSTVLMSAKITGSPSKSSANPNTQVHHFNQAVPIPSYLIAIVAGDLVSKQLGPRSHVWSEKGLINRSAWEFENVEHILKTAEELAGPYLFEVYDLLILPPSFPFGGMENPCLTFVTPTLLAGDRSLVYVVAHEIAHSWTGNLVTNQNFEHFWLNEGFTTFLERKIAGRIDAEGEKARQFAALEGLKDLRATVEAMGVENRLTQLVTDLRGINPDDAFSVVPYEKGHTFLFYLEQLLGGPTVFEPFLRAYIQQFKYKSIKTEQFKEYLIEYFFRNGTPQQNRALTDVNWSGWLSTPGYPLITLAYDTTLLNVSVRLANRWIEVSEDELKKAGPGPFKVEEFKALSSGQKKLFLIELEERTQAGRLSAFKLERLTELYQLRQEHNAEVQCVWIVLGLKSQWNGVVKEAVQFVKEIGRVKFIRPIYRALYQWPETKQLALDTFNANKGRMMALSVMAISSELGLK